MDGSTLTTVLFLGGFFLLHVFMHRGHGGHGGGGCCGGHGHGHAGHDQVRRDAPDDAGEPLRHTHAHDEARVGRRGSGDSRTRRDDGGWG